AGKRRSSDSGADPAGALAADRVKLNRPPSTQIGESMKVSRRGRPNIVSAHRTRSFGSPVVRITGRRLSPSPSCFTSLVLDPRVRHDGSGGRSTPAYADMVEHRQRVFVSCNSK